MEKKQIFAAGGVVALTAVSFAAVVAMRASSGSTPSATDSDTKTCRTDSIGWCAATLPFTPNSVVVEGQLPAVGNNIPVGHVVQLVSNGFRVRWINQTGKAITNLDITYDYTATQAPLPPPTTTGVPTTTPPTTTTPPPPPSAFPDATNTGTPAGTTLHACNTTITAPGTYDSCSFNGSITIASTGITISNSKIDGPVGFPDADLKGVTIQDTTVDCHCLSTSDNSTPSGVAGSNFTLLRVNLFDAGHGVAVQNNVVIQDSFIHGLGGPTQAHKDALYVGDGTNVQVKHNNIECNDGSGGCTSAIGLLSDFGTITDWTIDNNLLNTNGSYCFYGGGGPQKPFRPNHITFINNHFGRKDNTNCGTLGPVTYFDVNAAGNVWSGNVWDDTGATVDPVN